MNRNKSKPIILLMAGILWCGFTQAQTSVNTSGSDATGSGGSAAYSVGQVFYITQTGSSVTVAQGVQHAYEIYTIGIQENTGMDISLSIYPNPTSNTLHLQIDNYHNEKLSYQLYDVQGKLLDKGQIIAKQTQINMSSLPSAAYFVNVVNQKLKSVKSFKIIKK